MTRITLAPLPAAALAVVLGMGMAVQPSATLAQSACVGEASGGTRAMLKQLVACQQETRKATGALEEKITANTTALGELAKDVVALKSDVKAVRDDVRQLGNTMAGVEVVMGKTIEKLAQPSEKPDLSGIAQVLGQRFDTLAARVEKLLAENRNPSPGN